MARSIHFKCRTCEGEILVSPSNQDRVTCPHCKQSIEVFMKTSILNRSVVTACVSCGHDAFYVQKDFNRQLGLIIVTAGIAASIYFFARGLPIYAMSALGLTALIDFLAYSLVRSVTVCYSCHALYRGFERNPEHEAFDLKKLEKYGGRNPRSSL
jgi:hypothetical protein